jgi:hypothetical protein
MNHPIENRSIGPLEIRLGSQRRVTGACPTAHPLDPLTVEETRPAAERGGLINPLGR